MSQLTLFEDRSTYGVETEVCGKPFGRGLGGQQRTCRLYKGHSFKRHTDLPFLLHLKDEFRKIADKIERDSFNTRGASWGKDQEGKQKRRNRQPRWTLKEGEQLYPKHFQGYKECLEVARSLTIQVYCMADAPDCPDHIVNFLQYVPVRGSFVCPICRLPIYLADFEKSQQSLATIDTDHLDPVGFEYIHFAGNVCFTHHECNVAKGERSITQFQEWVVNILGRFGYRIEEPFTPIEPFIPY